MHRADSTTSKPGGPNSPSVLFLRNADQTCLALILMASLTAICWFGYCQGLLRGRLIDIEQSQPRKIEYQVDPNSATWQEWMMLPGIGEALARRIVAWRDENGPFRSAEELRRVPGIGAKILEKIRPHLQSSVLPDSSDKGGAIGS